MVNNYTISGNINFYEELLNDDTDTITSVERCLISNEPLDITSIALPCGHKFNYEPLYNEILAQKTDLPFNINTFKLLTGHIKCPYCRAIHDALLPPAYGIQNVHNIVNVNHGNSKWSRLKLKCKSEELPNAPECSYLTGVTPLGYYCKRHYNNEVKKSEVGVPDYMTPEMMLYEKSHTIPQLKAILSNNNIKMTGNKRDLVIRIFKFDLHVNENQLQNN
jgi:hypothetical protein